MRIIIDIQGCQSEGSRNRGIGRYSFNLISSLIRFYPDNEYILFANSSLIDISSDFLQFIYDYDGLKLDKDDFTKRRRVQTQIPVYLRCQARRANGEQCTRKKKDNMCYCGTHDKNRPHGVIDITNNENKLKKIEVRLQEINGILYYIDNFNNIYKTEDIVSNVVNPKVILNYINKNGKYSILNN